MSRKSDPSATIITPELLDGWIAQHGEVHELSVADSVEAFDPYKVPTADDEVLEHAVRGYLRKPNDRELSYAMSKLPAMIEAGKVLVKNCWLGGNDRILDEPALLTAAALQAMPLLEVRQAQLKKLRPSGSR